MRSYFSGQAVSMMDTLGNLLTGAGNRREHLSFAENLYPIGISGERRNIISMYRLQGVVLVDGL